MSGQRYMYTTYIRATADAVFHALTDAATTRAYWFHENISDWQPGSDWEHRRLDGSMADVVGKVVEAAPPHRLTLTWAAPADRDHPERQARVTFLTEPVTSTTRLTIIHDDLSPEMLQAVGEGWPAVLSSLKSLLETGRSLGDLWSGRHG